MDYLEKQIEKGWTKFINSIIKENKRKNERLFKLLVAIKGERFVSDLRHLIQITGTSHVLLRITKEPKGDVFRDRRFASIPQFWIEQRAKADGLGLKGTMFVQVKSERWIRINYEIE